MAAYGTLVSLMTLVDWIQHHPNPLITLEKHHVESLTKSVTFLLEFFENYSCSAIKEVADGLESHITDLAHAAEDVIESYIADQSHDGSTNQGAKIEQFYQDFQRVILDMDFLMKEVMEIKEKMGNRGHQLHRVSSKRNPLVGVKRAMVGFDDVRCELFDKLTGDEGSRQIIPIVGMAGIGKTMLASNVYEERSIQQHFDIRAWVTVSQNYNLRKILLKVVEDLNKKERREFLNTLSERELGNKLYKNLYNRRYLVVLDDIWSIEVWNELKRFFLDDNNRSRIIITTRQSSVISELSKDKIVMNFLDNDKSWNLLCNAAFGEEVCPIELEESGKKIAKDCKGLPLSITVMGGLLAHVKPTKEDWAFIAEKLNSSLNLEHEEHCLQILRTSFEYMPVHLKPCFLYMGIFPEDSEISKSELIKLWVDEGFVKPICGESLEMAAEEYLMDLIDRNLILVKLRGSVGNVKVCNIHDLTRDLCIKEAEKERFLCVPRKHNLGNEQGINVHRRIAIHQSTLKADHVNLALDALKSTSLVRSLVCHVENVFPQVPSRKLRIMNVTGSSPLDTREAELFLEDILQSMNLRFLAFHPYMNLNQNIFTSIYLLSSLQTLILRLARHLTLGIGIWRMHQLKHVKVILLSVPDPPLGGSTDVQDHELVLQNLQTLSQVVDFSLGEEVIKRIPDIRKLKTIYTDFFIGCSKYHLNNVGRLQKLESLSCNFKIPTMPEKCFSLQNMTFPHSLKRLKLSRASISWEDVTTVIGSLPHLQVLKLVQCSYGTEWNLVEGKFQQLRFLLINYGDLTYWTVQRYQFPCLERLYLCSLYTLEEIPPDIVDSPKLQSIEVDDCSNSTVNSAQRIVDEQEELGNADLKVLVRTDLGIDFVELCPNIQDDKEYI